MARINILDDRVRSLLSDGLVPLFLAEGSTAGLCKVLNTSLRAADIEGTIHPNRIHAMLSEDVSRGINEGTLALVEAAVEHARIANSEWKERAAGRRHGLIPPPAGPNRARASRHSRLCASPRPGSISRPGIFSP